MGRVLTQAVMRAQASTLNRALSTTPGANRDSLLAVRLSAYLPREANWVRQMEQKHERCLIPFEDVDGERNPQNKGVSISVVKCIVCFACKFFFLTSASEEVQES